MSRPSSAGDRILGFVRWVSGVSIRAATFRPMSPSSIAAYNRRRVSFRASVPCHGDEIALTIATTLPRVMLASGCRPSTGSTWSRHGVMYFASVVAASVGAARALHSVQ